MEFNYFGCSVDDIVNYYHDTTISDYETNSLSGSDVILSELDYSEMKVLEALPATVANVLQNGIPYVLVWDQQNLGLEGVNLSDLNSTSSFLTCSTGRCPGSVSELFAETTSTVSISAGVVTITNYNPNKEYYAKLEFTDTLVLSSLKRLVRDLTACRLGSQLYSRGEEQEWTSVKRACEESEKLLDLIRNDPYWMPYELRKLKYYPGTSPIKSKNGLYSIRISRS